MIRMSLALLVALAGCSGPTANEAAAPAENGSAAAPADNVAAAAPTPAPAQTGVVPAGATAKREADYAGRWIGVEGMYLVVTPRPAGGVGLEMQYDLDNKATVDGVVTEEGIRFERNGETLVLRPSDGDATGLKYLAGKKDCLTVKSGEGYCRA